jgi:signal transduction histidine kinase
MLVKSIKSKIKQPFLILLILIPLITLLLFNLSLRIYINQTTKRELLATVKTVEKVLKSELITYEGIGVKKDALVTIKNILSALRTSRLSPGVELYLLNSSQQLIYPSNEDLTSSQKTFLNNLSSKPSQMEQEKVYSVSVGRMKFYTVSYTLSEGKAGNFTGIFALPMDRVNAYLQAVNLILIVIMVLGILAAIFFSEKIAAYITKPISELKVLSLKIGQGDFHAVELTGPEDTLEFNQLYENMALMANRLDAYDRNQKTFLQNASHELRTPLMSIQGYAEGIESGIFSDAKEAAQVIKKESIRLNELVNELLTLSRYESGTYKLQREETNLCHLLQDYVQRLMGLTAKSGKELVLKLPAYEVILPTDDSLLSQAVMNIASNCLRYAKNQVIISLEQRTDRIILRISDDGDGIPANDLPHIFDRFYKGSKGNFGLGLAIAKSAVELLHGRIEAYNSREEGAVFEIVFQQNSSKPL